VAEYKWGRRGVELFAGRELQYALLNFLGHLVMKNTLLTTIAAVVLVGCGPSVDIQQAAKDGNIEAVKQAIAASTDVNTKDRYENTPLHQVAKFGHKEIAELLIANGADVNAKRGRGWTPLHDTNNKKIIELLITKGADVNSKCDNGQTPLHNAATVPNISKAELLITNGADVNAMLYNPQGEGGTAMDLCINLRIVSTVNMQKILPPDGMPRLDENNILTDGYNRFADLLRKHGGKTKKELEAAGN